MVERVARYRLLLVVAAGSAILWCSTAFTASVVLAEIDPRLALKLWPTDAARTSVAWQLLATTGTLQKSDSATAETLSKQVLAHEAMSAAATRNLGMAKAVAGAPTDRLRKIFASAERLSRRDVPTQLWMIEDNVGRDDVKGALGHYDTIMRSSRTAQLTLLPQLVYAAGDRPVADALGKILAERPNWWLAFFDQMLADSDKPDTIAFLTRRLRLDPGKADEHERLGRSLTRLVELGAYEPAFVLFRSARAPSGGPVGWPQNGDFSLPNPLPPFEWAIAADPELGGVIEPRAGSHGPALTLIASNGRKGVVARQLMLLPAASYVLRARIGASAPASKSPPAIELSCAPSGAIVGRAPLTADAKGTVAVEFVIPGTACRAQWLSVTAQAADGGSDEAPWIDAVTMSKQ